jgi:hypothetical protein
LFISVRATYPPGYPARGAIFASASPPHKDPKKGLVQLYYTFKAATLARQYDPSLFATLFTEREMWAAYRYTLPPSRLNTDCTALSLIASLNDNTVRNFPTHGQLSAAQGSPTTVSA